MKKTFAIGVSSLVACALIIVFVLWSVQKYYELSFGDIFSLGQLLVDLFFVPIVIIGFLFAIAEFRSSHRMPELSLYWDLPNGDIGQSLELDITQVFLSPRLIVKNIGDVVTRWYLVRFEIPRNILGDRYPQIERQVGGGVIEIGENDPHWHIEEYSDKYIITFMSNGEFALYPNYPQPLCFIYLVFRDESYPIKSKVSYEIYSDFGHEKRGALTLKLVGFDLRKPYVPEIVGPPDEL